MVSTSTELVSSVVIHTNKLVLQFLYSLNKNNITIALSSAQPVSLTAALVGGSPPRKTVVQGAAWRLGDLV